MNRSPRRHVNSVLHSRLMLARDAAAATS